MKEFIKLFNLIEDYKKSLPKKESFVLYQKDDFKFVFTYEKDNNILSIFKGCEQVAFVSTDTVSFTRNIQYPIFKAENILEVLKKKMTTESNTVVYDFKSFYIAIKELTNKLNSAIEESDNINKLNGYHSNELNSTIENSLIDYGYQVYVQTIIFQDVPQTYIEVYCGEDEDDSTKIFEFVSKTDGSFNSVGYSLFTIEDENFSAIFKLISTLINKSLKELLPNS